MFATGWILAAAVIVGVAIFLALAALLVWRPYRLRRKEAQFARARQDFHRLRERLEVKFFALASQGGKPRGLEWTGCEFEDAVVYARDRRNGQLSAFVGVTISFAAVPGGEMDEVEAVGDLRAATAVFRLDHRCWNTDGRAIFNLNPAEAVRFFQENLELVR
jgi:hypothetical protein